MTMVCKHVMSARDGSGQAKRTSKRMPPRVRVVTDESRDALLTEFARHSPLPSLLPSAKRLFSPRPRPSPTIRIMPRVYDYFRRCGSAVDTGAVERLYRRGLPSAATNSVWTASTASSLLERECLAASKRRRHLTYGARAASANRSPHGKHGSSLLAGWTADSGDFAGS